MSATPKQIALIEKLQGLGAPIPCKGDGDGPDFSMFDSVQNADLYLKRWGPLMVTRKCNTCSAQDWGGIPNC